MQPTDFVGQRLHEGDIIAFAVGTHGSRRSRMVVGRIEKFNFKSVPSGKFTAQPCPQHMATSWTARVRPLKWTGHRAKDQDGRVKSVTATIPQNIVKLCDGVADTFEPDDAIETRS